ncbi:MAG: DUF255 domain-containing protein [Actinobacteria bacterium]|nr:DUF255 domain-containing protein [Actinomycetota bacterium]
MSNRLASETSPYLLQHKDNPVDWFPWGDEALRRARAEDKPILLSVGYAACHWCHVMERESFESPDIARIMNDNFVSVKVDREERPDIDAIYMEAVQAMTGQGGWPMTVFLTPDGVPFYGGTYFPPDDRHGMPSFTRVLTGVAEAWRSKRSDVQEQGKRLLDHIDVASKILPSSDVIGEDILRSAFRSLAGGFDREHGGFGNAPKFPQPMTIDLLHRLHARGYSRAGAMARLTLDAMAKGGIYDQIGGGFARYSVDRQWLVPHFEKMLYDNAQLIRTYTHSWLSTGSELHREVVERTVEWLFREMRDAAGGFYSSLDADSEGEEGRFYVWTIEQVRRALDERAEDAIGAFGMTEQGNFEGANILVRAHARADPKIDELRQALLEARSTRVRPATDDKILTAWNALTISALAEAGATFEREDWIASAAAAMRFLMTSMRRDGRLMRAYRDGRVRHLGFAEDYAFYLEASLSLFEATFDQEWVDEARWVADEAILLFHDSDRGGFFTTGADAERLITRSKDLIDNAVPSANSVMAMELQRLSMLTGGSSYERHAIDAIRSILDAAKRSPQGFGHLLGAVDLYTGDPKEVVIVGSPARADWHEMKEAMRHTYLPNKVLVIAQQPDAEDARRIPLLADRVAVDGRATAYVCRRGICDLPVHSAAELLAQLR